MKKIAIVEDDEWMREEFGEMLLRAGYETILISDFSDTVQTLLSLSPDLILLDINLPGKSGFQICREIKQKSAIPVLILTSRDMTSCRLWIWELTNT